MRAHWEVLLLSRRAKRSASVVQLPAIAIFTADHDDRVVPGPHAFKAAATLQAVAGASAHQKHPLLIRIEQKAGHGAGKPTSKILDEVAETYAFLYKELGMTLQE